MSTKKREAVPGSIYLLHFDRPYKHARHYLGWSSDVAARFDRHTAGRGSPLVKAALAAGIGVEIVFVRPGTRHDERRLHIRGHVGEWCPLCRRPPAKRKSASRRTHLGNGHMRTRCGRPVETVKLVIARDEDPGADPCRRCFGH